MAGGFTKKEKFAQSLQGGSSHCDDYSAGRKAEEIFMGAHARNRS
jgi:hypothetical protein